jgi:hypothetical protein
VFSPCTVILIIPDHCEFFAVIGTSCHPERPRDGAGTGRFGVPGCGEITIGIQQILAASA